jgi:hypothetical protein
MSDAEVESYGTAMLNAVSASNGFAGSIISAEDDILATATGLEQGDYDGLVGLAELINSSGDTWYSYQQGGGFGQEQIYLEQSFLRGYFWFGGRCEEHCKGIIWADGWGYLGGFFTGGGIAGGVVWGVVASAIAAY